MNPAVPARPAEGARVFTARFPWFLFWIALAIRLASMTLAHYYRVNPLDDHFDMGWEMGRIAKSLVTGHGYGNPFDHPSGPTAWVTPLYPFLMAGAFQIFGVYSKTAAWCILALDCVLNALMLRTIWEMAGRCFDRRVAVWAVWIWALYPAAMQYAVKWFWDMTLTTFLFTCVLVLSLRMRNIGGDPAEDGRTATTGRWALFGLLWGLIALSDASLVIFLPFCGLWVLSGQPGLRRQMPRVALAGVLSIACIAPWTVRNARVFHHFVPMRNNFGAELWMGNLPQLHGMLIGSPVALPTQEALYDRMGEYNYCHWHGRQAMRNIRSHLGAFAALSLRRLYFFWADVPHAEDRGKQWTEVFRDINFQFTSMAGIFGLILALRRRRPAAWLFAMAFASVPFLYYFVFVSARLRHPLEPLIDILGVYLFQTAEKSWRVRWWGRSPGW